MRWLKSFLLALLVTATLAAQGGIRQLTILHTNDLHAHFSPSGDGLGGFAYLAAAIRKETAHCAACLTLNAGDLVQGTPVSTIYRGLPVYQVANLLGFDAGTVGNHEFDYGWRQIGKFVALARYPIVSANLLDAAGRPATGKAYVIKNVGGVRVAIIGAILSDLVGNFATPEAVGELRVAPLLPAIRRAVDDIGNRADLIVVLGHLHNSETEQILKEVPQVSVIVAGHEHEGYGDMKRVGARVAVQLRAYGVELGRLDLQVDLPHRSVVAANWKRIPIDTHQIAPAPDVARVVLSWEAKVSRIVDIPIGTATHRMAEQEVRSLVERAMAEETGADFAWVNLGNIRDFLPAGRLLARNVWNVLPFDNHIVTGRFKGSRLPPAMTAEHPVDPNQEYTVATTDFTAANQASSDQLSTTGLEFPKIGPLQRDAVIDWIRKKQVVP